MNDDRLNPDDLLKLINENDKASKQGKLRIFLGMSAGVGKTFAMLKAAHQKKNEGVYVIVGAVETHGRAETANLIQDLKIIGRKKYSYRNTEMFEMDLETILKLKPDLVVVDELAHTNVPGSRHEKRYQDVIELLESGIDVYTALNVQHLESRKDSVEAITGIMIRETVPDSILDRAHLIEVVDIAPSELLKRLSEGKIYLGDKAAKAADAFFKEDKLTALREIALRLTAERVDQDLQKLSITKNGKSWKINERLLVAVSHSPYSEKLIRTARRLASNLDSPWMAVYIDTGLQLSDDDQAQLIKNLNLARELNAEVITTTDVSLPTALNRICRQKNVTQIILGRPRRRWFQDLIEGGSLLQKLVKETPDVDLHIVSTNLNFDHKVQLNLWDQLSLYRTKTGLKKYWYTLCFMIFMTSVGVILEPFLGYRTVGFIFLLGVLIVGVFGSLGAVMWAAVLSAFTWNFIFIPPRFTFVISASEDVTLCFVYFVVALIIGFLTQRIRFHEQIIREREERTNVLYQILKDISSSQNKAEFINKITQRIGSLLKGHSGVVLKSKNGKLDLNKNNSYLSEIANFDEKEQAVALWCFENKKSLREVIS